MLVHHRSLPTQLAQKLYAERFVVAKVPRGLQKRSFCYKRFSFSCATRYELCISRPSNCENSDTLPWPSPANHLDRMIWERAVCSGYSRCGKQRYVAGVVPVSFRKMWLKSTASRLSGIDSCEVHSEMSPILTACSRRTSAFQLATLPIVYAAVEILKLLQRFAFGISTALSPNCPRGVEEMWDFYIPVNPHNV